MYRHCIGRALSCRSRCPPGLPKAHRFSWRAGSGRDSFPAVSVGSSYTSPLLLYRCADNQSRKKLLPTCSFTFALPKTVDYYDTYSGTSLYGLSRCISVWLLKVFSLSIAVQPLSCCPRFSHRHQATMRSCEYRRCPYPLPCDLPCAS